MTSAKFFLGFPVEFKNICLVYPPQVKEVLGNKNFLLYEKILTSSQEEIEDEYVENGEDTANLLNPFEYILNLSYYNKEYKRLVEESFYFFIHESVFIMPEYKQIIVGELSEIQSLESMRVIKEEDFFDFQNLIRQALGRKTVEPPNPNEDPRVKRIKAKARYRDKVKARSGKGLKFNSTLASICCMDLGLNPLNIGELSYASIPVLMQVYQNKEKYRLDIDSILAGGDSKKIKPKYWIQNLEDL